MTQSITNRHAAKLDTPKMRRGSVWVRGERTVRVDHVTDDVCYFRGADRELKRVAIKTFLERYIPVSTESRAV